MHEALPRPVHIARVIQETPTIRTFVMDTEFSFTPGQFVMVWVPGVDEIPMALSSGSTITVQEVGDATAALFRLNEGDMIGIRGPLGKGFSLTGSAIAVAGGVGAAPLLPLAVAGKLDTFLLGAKTETELLFADVLGEHTSLEIATDDGSCGHHGFVTQLLEEKDLSSLDHICICGPEMMMAASLQVLEERDCAEKGQLSLHRYMKCGIGICGSCCIDPAGFCVCRDGPVFAGNALIGSELGRYRRDGSGRIENFP